MAKGGTRIGGKPKGYKAPNTLEKVAARELARKLITAQMRPMIEAQVANAMGIKYLVVRDKKTGKFERVSEGMARLAEGKEHIEVWEKDPSVQAFTDLMNRAIDKPAEQEQAIAVSGDLVVSWRNPKPS